MKYIFLLLLTLYHYSSDAQSTKERLDQAIEIEKKLDDALSLEAYKNVLAIDSKNLIALVKCAEYCSSIGARQKSTVAKKNWYLDLLTYANLALNLYPNAAEANYAMALCAGKFTEIETENKKILEYVREVKLYGDKALASNPNDAKSNYLMGKWHFQMITLSWVKKAAVKAFYGGLPEAELDSAIKYMEKCRSIDKYFALNYLDLAKAYNQNREPAKAIAILKLLLKLATRCFDDTAIKEEGKNLLEKLS